MASYEELMDEIKSYYMLYMENTDTGNKMVSEIAKLSYRARRLKIDTRFAIKSGDPNEIKSVIKSNMDLLSRLVAIRKSLNPNDFSMIYDFSNVIKIIGRSIITISNMSINNIYNRKVKILETRGKNIINADGTLKDSKQDAEEALDILASLGKECTSLDRKSRILRGALDVGGELVVSRTAEKARQKSYNAMIKELDKSIIKMTKSIRKIQKAFP